MGFNSAFKGLMLILQHFKHCPLQRNPLYWRYTFPKVSYIYIYVYKVARRGHAVAQLVEALRYKLEGRGFNSRWRHWNFSLT